MWSDQNVDVTTRCNVQGMNNFRAEDIDSISYVLLATNTAVSPILSLQDQYKTFLDIISFHMILRKYEYVTKSLSTDTYEGYQICETEVLEIPVGIAFFLCKSGSVISSLLLCNGIIDCPNKDTSDEQFCQCSYSEAIVNSKHCKEISKGNRRMICSELYYTAQGACHQYIKLKNDQIVSQAKNDIQTCNCKECSMVDTILYDDLYGDCLLAEDEPILTSLLMNHVITPCADPSQIPCLQGHPKMLQHF